MEEDPERVETFGDPKWFSGPTFSIPRCEYCVAKLSKYVDPDHFGDFSGCVPARYDMMLMGPDHLLQIGLACKEGFKELHIPLLGKISKTRCSKCDNTTIRPYKVDVKQRVAILPIPDKLGHRERWGGSWMAHELRHVAVPYDWSSDEIYDDMINDITGTFKSVQNIVLVVVSGLNQYLDPGADDAIVAEQLAKFIERKMNDACRQAGATFTEVSFIHWPNPGHDSEGLEL